MAQDGFGQLKNIRAAGGERTIFFKISGTMIDTDIFNHTNILKMAELSVEQYSDIFRDLSRTNRNLLNSHPYIEEFRESLNL